MRELVDGFQFSDFEGCPWAVFQLPLDRWHQRRHIPLVWWVLGKDESGRF